VPEDEDVGVREADRAPRLAPLPVTGLVYHCDADSLEFGRATSGSRSRSGP